MAFCDKCGTLWSDLDLAPLVVGKTPQEQAFPQKEHECRLEDIPERGKQIRADGTKEDLRELIPVYLDYFGHFGSLREMSVSKRSYVECC